MPVVLYAYGMWSVTLREQGFRVFEKRAMSRILGPRGRSDRGLEEVTS